METPATEADIESPPREPSPARLKRRARVMAALVALLVLMAINLAIGSDRLRLERVVSESMTPTLRVRDVLLADPNALIRRDDIVIFEDPENPEEKMVKRVIGMPGDLVLIQDGALFVNGRPHPGAGRDGPRPWRDVRVNIPAASYFVMGDNRTDSYDSLHFGPVALGDIHGVMIAVVWPPRRWSRPARLLAE